MISKKDTTIPSSGSTLPPPRANPINRKLPSLTTIPSLITPGLVDITGFIKYSKLNLMEADNILPFYKNVYPQELQYNMVLLPCKNILPDSGIYHPDLPEDTMKVIDTTLGTIFREDGGIA